MEQYFCVYHQKEKPLSGKSISLTKITAKIVFKYLTIALVVAHEVATVAGSFCDQDSLPGANFVFIW